jgi:hypothetical protein
LGIAQLTRARYADIDDDNEWLPLQVTLSINDEAAVFFPLSGAEGPRSTSYKVTGRFIETKESLDFNLKKWLFQRDWDQELAAKTKWTTVADPYFAWRQVSQPHSNCEPTHCNIEKFINYISRVDLIY